MKTLTRTLMRPPGALTLFRDAIPTLFRVRAVLTLF